MLYGTGIFYQANGDGSNPREVENANVTMLHDLYTYPNGLYYKFSGGADTVDKIELD